MSPGDPERTDDRLLAWPQVRAIVGLSRTTAWRLQKSGLFPLPVQVSVNRVAWRESEIEAWCAARAPRTSRSPFLTVPARAPAATSSQKRPSEPQVFQSFSSQQTGSSFATTVRPSARPRRSKPPADQMSFDF